MKACPSCRKRIQDAASKCHYCGTVVRPPRTPNAADADKPASPARQDPPDPRVPLAFRIAIAILVFGAAMAWLVW